MTENIVSPNVPDPVGADDHPPVSPVIPSAPVLSNVEGVDGSQGKKFPLLTFFLILTLSLLAAFSIYMFLQVRTLTLEKLTPSPTASAIALASADPTATWQAYTNEAFDFSFRYPQELFIIDSIKSVGDRLLVQNYQEEKSMSNTEKDLQVVISVGLNEDRSLDWYPKNAKREQGIEKTTIGGLEAIRGFSPEEGNTIVWVIRSKYIFSIQLTTPNTNIDNKITFDQILSTFKFTDTATPKPSLPTSPLPKLNYSIPSGWTKIADPTGKFEAAYDPANTQLFEGGAKGLNLTRKSLNDDGIGYKSYLGMQLLAYTGGSKHSFIYQVMNNGETPGKQDLSDTYFEKEYSYNGKTCLFLNGIYLSQYPSIWGMCDAGGGQAFLITSYDPDPKVYLQTVQTIKLAK